MFGFSFSDLAISMPAIEFEMESYCSPKTHKK